MQIGRQFRPRVLNATLGAAVPPRRRVGATLPAATVVTVTGGGPGCAAASVRWPQPASAIVQRTSNDVIFEPRGLCRVVCERRRTALGTRCATASRSVHWGIARFPAGTFMYAVLPLLLVRRLSQVGICPSHGSTADRSTPDTRVDAQISLNSSAAAVRGGSATGAGNTRIPGNASGAKSAFSGAPARSCDMP